MSWTDHVPAHRHDAVRTALRHAFGTDDVEEATPLGGGLSTAVVLRVTKGGTTLLLRVITRTDPMAEPTHQFACVQAAAKAGLAPRVRHADAEGRVLLTDYVEPVPLPDAAGAMLARRVRALHALAPFARTFDYFATVDGFVERFAAAEAAPAGTIDELTRHYRQLRASYTPSDDDLVASHNDLKPENVVFDGLTPWMVDFEAAGLNDRYVDLSVVSNFFVPDESEDTFLGEYFGRPPTLDELARFTVTRQLVHVAYAALIGLLTARSGMPLRTPEEAPDFAEYHRRYRAGQESLATRDGQWRCAMAHLARALANARAGTIDRATLRLLAPL